MQFLNLFSFALVGVLSACSSSMPFSTTVVQSPTWSPASASIHAASPLSHAFRIPGGTLLVVGYPERESQVSIQLVNAPSRASQWSCAKFGTSAPGTVTTPFNGGEVGSQNVSVCSQLSALSDLTIAGSWLEVCGQRFALSSEAKAELEAYLREFRMRALPMKEWPSRSQARPRSQAFGPIVASGL